MGPGGQKYEKVVGECCVMLGYAGCKGHVRLWGWVWGYVLCLLLGLFQVGSSGRYSSDALLTMCCRAVFFLVRGMRGGLKREILFVLRQGFSVPFTLPYD